VLSIQSDLGTWLVDVGRLREDRSEPVECLGSHTAAHRLPLHDFATVPQYVFRFAGPAVGGAITGARGFTASGVACPDARRAADGCAIDDQVRRRARRFILERLILLSGGVDVEYAEHLKGLARNALTRHRAPGGSAGRISGRDLRPCAALL
jgi:hypothetical protein